MTAALLLLVPLGVVIAVALALFGTDGPAGGDMRGQATLRLLGMGYGVYLMVLSFMWSRRRARNERR